MDFTNAGVVELNPRHVRPDVLTPETPVDVINRSHSTVVVKFDAFDYPLTPHSQGPHRINLLRVPYGAALHFQKHAVVPGTRNLDAGVEQSYIGIVRNATTGEPIDPPELCEPFTREECERFGLAVEAIQRDPDEPIERLNVGAAVAAGRVPIGKQTGGGARGRKVLQRQGTGNIKDVMAPPTDVDPDGGLAEARAGQEAYDREDE
jgi:hypothetical protein